MSNPDQKVAIVLFNLGAPDNPKAVRPFLLNLFADKAILPLPQPFRYLLANYIVFRRLAKSKKIYSLIGGSSPLLPNTEKQASSLEAFLNGSAKTKSRVKKKPATDQFRCFIAMRYWHPFSDECARDITEWGADRIVLLPLYPQFSTTTTQSSLLEWKNVARRHGLDRTPAHTICCWPTMTGFVDAACTAISKELERVRDKSRKWHVLFSAHGIPENFVGRFGDPYPAHVKAGATRMAASLGLENHQWSISYQSRVGKAVWLQPYTEARLKELAKQQNYIIVCPISFVSDHSETLVELDIEFKELAMEHGASGYSRAATVGTHPAFIEGLAGAIFSSLAGEANTYTRICPRGAFGCHRRSRYYTATQNL